MVKIRIFIVEDDADWLKKIIDFFDKNKDFEVVGTAMGLRGALEKILKPKLKIDFAILDIELGKETYGGIKIAAELQKMDILFGYLTRESFYHSEEVQDKVYRTTGGAPLIPISFISKIEIDSKNYDKLKILARKIKQKQAEKPIIITIEGHAIKYDDFLYVRHIKNTKIIYWCSKAENRIIYINYLKVFKDVKAMFSEWDLEEEGDINLSFNHKNCRVEPISEGKRKYRYMFCDVTHIRKEDQFINGKSISKVVLAPKHAAKVGIMSKIIHRVFGKK